MNINWTLILTSPWPYLLTAFIAVLIGLYIWKQPQRPGTRYFRWLVVIWFIWSLVAALHNLTSSLEIRYILWVIQGASPLIGPPLVLMIVLEYTGNDKWLKYRSLNLLFLPALLMIFISFWPNSVSSLEVHSGIQVFRASDLVRWGFYAYFVAIMLVTLVILFACLLRAPAFWAPIWLLILGRVIPMIGYPIPALQQLSVPIVQSGLLFLGITMILYFIALYSFQILQVSPVARDTVIAHMPYSLLVFDAGNRLVDFNPAALSLPSMPEKLNVRKAAFQQIPDWWDKLEKLLSDEATSKDIIFTTGENNQIFRITSVPLKQASGLKMGQAFLLEDVTNARKAEQLQTQAQQVMATLQERERLARELHDELAQNLALINLQAQLSKDMLAQGKIDLAQEQLENLAKETLRAQVDVREEISKLLHRKEEEENFLAELKNLLQNFQKTFGIRVQYPDFEEKGLINFDPKTEVQLLRIIQEVLTNIRKHAQASSVEICLTSGNESTMLLIEDNGVGFDVSNLSTKTHSYGLGIISERAKEFDGSVKVESTPGKGTRITVNIPHIKEGI